MGLVRSQDNEKVARDLSDPILSAIAWPEKRRQGGGISSRTRGSGPRGVQAPVTRWQGLGWAAFLSQIELCPATEGSSQARFMLLYYCFSTLPCHFLLSLASTHPFFFTCGGESQEESKSRKEGERKWGFGRVMKCQWPYRPLSQKERRGKKRKERRYNHYDFKGRKQSLEPVSYPKRVSQEPSQRAWLTAAESSEKS